MCLEMTIEICCQGGIKETMDEYYRVSPIQMSEGSDLDSQGQPYFKQSRRKSGSDFGNIFISACDELKMKTGITHQSRGYTPGLALAR